MWKPHWHCCRDCLQCWVTVPGQRWMNLMTVCEHLWNFLWRGPSHTESPSHVLLWVINDLLIHSSMSPLEHPYVSDGEKKREKICLLVNITKRVYNSKRLEERAMIDRWIISSHLQGYLCNQTTSCYNNVFPRKHSSLKNKAMCLVPFNGSTYKRWHKNVH